MKTQKTSGKRKLMMVALSIVAAVVIVGGILMIVRNKKVKEFQQAAKDYVQEVNEDDIAVDLSENPYFMTKIPGFQYASAERISYQSKVTNTTKHARILLPVDYDESKEYPVLYLLHGWGGSDKTWLNKDADIIIQNTFYLNDVPEMIVVFPNSCVNEEEDVDDMSFIEASHVYDLTAEEIMTSLMPYVNEYYSTMTDRDHTAVAGYSLGGKESLYTAFTNQDIFGYVGAFSAVSPIPDSEFESYAPTLEDLIIDETYGGFHYVLINVGIDDPYIRGTYIIEDELVANDIPHTYYEMEGEHENSVWQNALYNFLRHIF